MNRFYKPTPREYVSTQVDMPWEFLQGVAEQKQKGYDTALSTSDAAANLLNFEVIPGDVETKKELQKKYNDRILEAQNYVQQTGDFNKASRDLAGIVRDIAQDPYINNMKAAVPIWKEQQKEKDKLTSEGEILDFNNTWDYMYSTVDKETGSTRSYNQKLPYKARTLGKAFYDDVKDAIDGRVIQQFGNRVQKVNGEWVSKKTGQRLSNELLPIMSTALQEIIPRYPNYFRDRTKHEIQQGVSKADKTPNWIDKMTKALAAEYHVDNIEFDYNYDEKDMYIWKKEQDKLAEQAVLTPGQDASLVTQEYDPIDLTDLTYTTSTNVDLSKEGIRGLQSVSTQTLPTTFQTLPEKYRGSFEKMYKLYRGEDAYNSIKSGKTNITRDELNYFTTIYNNLHKGLRTNTSTAPIGTKPAEISAKHGELFGVPEESVKAEVLTTGPAGYSPSTKIYDAKKGEWTTFADVEKKQNKKDIMYRVNKRYTTQNPLYMLSENDKRFVKGYSLISEDGQHQYIIPEKEGSVSQADELQAQIGSAIYNERVPIKVDLLSTDDNNVFAVYQNGLFGLMSANPQTGVPEYYTDEKGDAVLKTSATDMQKWIMQNAPKK
jgi:hypothetical protein